MTLPEAIRIALDNSEIVRVIAFGGSGLPVGSCMETSLKIERPETRECQARL